MTERMADCHPDRPYYAKGLCMSCYQKQRYKNPDFAERAKKRARAYYHRKRNDPEWVEGERKRGRENVCKRSPEQLRDAQYRYNYGITLEEYDNMLNAQDNECATCGKTPEENGQRLAVDHDHASGQVRSLLCRNCNRVLGWVKEDPEVLESLAEYLRFWNSNLIFKE